MEWNVTEGMAESGRGLQLNSEQLADVQLADIREEGIEINVNPQS